MKRLLSIFFILFSNFLLYAQIEPSITLDPISGNYIIRYQDFNNDTYEVIFEPSTKIEPQVQANIYFINELNVYEYNYIVRNGEDSKQRLLYFNVDFYSTILSILNPNNEWRSGTFSFRNTIDWGHTMVRIDGMRSPRSGIAPDSSASGFSFQSKGLPGIVNSYFQGAANIVLAFPTGSPPEVSDLLEPLRRFPANTVQLKTLGPKNPPDPFISTTFLDTLISYKHQAFDLGWIDNQGIQNSLDQKLDNAKKQLEKGKTKQAVNMLNAFLNEVEAQNGKHLTSEAYALLKYNAEYLIEKLEE